MVRQFSQENNDEHLVIIVPEDVLPPNAMLTTELNISVLLIFSGLLI